MTSDLILHYTNDLERARQLAQEGYEPIECAFGGETVLGPLKMDHHGPESWRDGVALRACRDHYGARKDDPRFVVTGTPDADAVLAIIGLAALVPKEKIPPAFYELVDRHDIDPIHLDLLDEEYGEELLFFEQIQQIRHDAESFYRALDVMIDLLENGLSEEQRLIIRKKEEKRIELAEKCEQIPLGDAVLFVNSKVWGFDRWYRTHPIVVSFAGRNQNVTIGCKDVETAEKFFGKGGLLNVFGKLGEGWGGRESIGGSPRGRVISYEEARQVAKKVAEFLQDAQ